MGDAPFASKDFLRLIQRVQQKRQEGQIVAQRRASGKAMPGSQDGAQAAVNGAKPLLAFAGKGLDVGNDIPKQVERLLPATMTL